ncbi:MAG: hypothetical protein LBH42_00170 [Treponema sp.]|jgi:hypothetical protein|nr:hypothetical protein [Treponema sp.]
MKKWKAFLLGMLAMGMIVLSGCASSKYMVLNEQMKPDARTAVVIFLGSSSTKAQIWDGERPVGTLKGTPSSSMNCIHWRATPGAHTFVARSTNFVHVRMILLPNRIYYVRIHAIPAPYANPIAMNEVSKQQYDEFRERWRIRDIAYDDQWRKDFLAEQNGKWLKDVREYLRTAK